MHLVESIKVVEFEINAWCSRSIISNNFVYKTSHNLVSSPCIIWIRPGAVCLCTDDLLHSKTSIINTLRPKIAKFYHNITLIVQACTCIGWALTLVGLGLLTALIRVATYSMY